MNAGVDGVEAGANLLDVDVGQCRQQQQQQQQ